MASSVEAPGPLPGALSHIAVIVPAHNEDRLIGACLHAIHRAAHALAEAMERPPRVTTVVVLDHCDDATAEVVAGHPDVTTVEISARCVGTSRRAGADAVLEGSTDPSGWWLANTDADSAVPRHWLTAMAEHARSGADLVLGTVRPDSALDPALRRSWSRRYVARDGHPHVHGANFGLSAIAYRRLGGWPHLTSGEDVALGRRAEQFGLRIIRTAGAPVLTSARLRGRAPSGFAAYLADLSDPQLATG